MINRNDDLDSQERLRELIFDNRLLQAQVDSLVDKLKLKIDLFELLIEVLSTPIVLHNFSQNRKGFRRILQKQVENLPGRELSSSKIPRRRPRSFSLSTRAKPIRVGAILDFITPWIPSNVAEWDVYRICVQANRAASTNPISGTEEQRKKASFMLPIDPMMIRRALEVKVQSLLSMGGEEERHKINRHVVMINLLLPPHLVCKERMAIRPTRWNKIFLQESLETVAHQLRVTPKDLEENIKKMLLSTVSRSLMGVDFEKISIDLCGSEKLSFAIFFVARTLSIRPEI